MQENSKPNWYKLFYIDRESPSGLRWLVDNNGKTPKNKRYAGDVAGFQKATSKGVKQYWRVKLDGVNYAVHRIIYEMVHGEIPDGMVLNHIDNNTFNNRIENLELCTHKENCRRRKNHTLTGLNVNNTSGVSGVSFDIKWNKERTKKVEYWKACYNDLNGKNVSRCFRVDVHGYKQAYEMALQWRKDQLEYLNSLGAGYTERHSYN